MNLRFRLLIIACVSVGLVGSLPLPAKDNKKQEADALLAQARDLSDIKCMGCPPFKLRARFRWWESNGREVRGLYMMNWISPGQWRDDLSSSMYRQTRVRKGDKLWRYRDFSKTSAKLLRFLETVDLHSSLTLNPDEEVGKIMDRSNRSENLKCFETISLGRGNNIPCFNAGTGLLEQAGNDSFPTYYQDYSPFGSKSFPRRIHSMTKGNPELEIDIEQLTQADPPENGALEVPVGATDSPTCDTPAPARLVERPQLAYPPVAKFRKIEGLVRIVGEINAQGKFLNGVIDVSPDPLLTDAALKAISTWTFEPANCSGTKLAQEAQINIDFALR